MNKEILKRNIEQVIMQPCNSKYPTRIVPNGLSEDGTHICVKVTPDDSSMVIRLKWLNNGEFEDIDYVQTILDNLPDKYRDHLVTLKHTNWISYSYEPVFDTDTQAIWDKELDTFYKAKQEWSEEDERIINDLVSQLGNLYARKLIKEETKDKYVTWLKSIRPQNTRKPSDEHYELEEFAKIVRGNLTGISRTVQKLFEAKYLQLTGNKMYGGFKD